MILGATPAPPLLKVYHFIAVLLRGRKNSRLTPRASLYFVGFLHPGGVSNPLVALGTSASLSHRVR